MLAAKIRQSTLAIAKSGKTAALEAVAATVAQNVRAEYKAKLSYQKQLTESMQRAIENVTGPLNRQVDALTKQRDEATAELKRLRAQQAETLKAAAAKAAAEAVIAPWDIYDGAWFKFRFKTEDCTPCGCTAC